jgi:hypothetical protein
VGPGEANLNQTLQMPQQAGVGYESFVNALLASRLDRQVLGGVGSDVAVWGGAEAFWVTDSPGRERAWCIASRDLGSRR